MKKVLVFPETALKQWKQFEKTKVVTDPVVIHDTLAMIFREGNLRYVDREPAETDPSVKQLIPYCVLMRPSGRVFAYRRTKKGGESRLHDKWSVGIGGHIEPVDGEQVSWDTYYRGMAREVEEEVGLKLHSGGIRDSVAGLLYDNSDEVGRVHFGVVHFLHVSTIHALTCTDPALANGEWIDPKLLVEPNGCRLENWSELVVRHIL